MKSREPFNGPRVSQLREAGALEQKLLLGGLKSWRRASLGGDGKSRETMCSI